MPGNEKQIENTSLNQSEVHGGSSLDESSNSAGPSTPRHCPVHGRRNEVNIAETSYVPSLLKKDPVLIYGELVILGSNGTLPQGDKGRRRSKFLLCKRTVSNGVRKSKHYVVKKTHLTKAILDTQAIMDTNQHTISYFSQNEAVIVEYMPDDQTDMFQIGRSAESPIDFVVMDTVPGDKTAKRKLTQSTISRFACRILIERSANFTTRVYAAGFDSSRNIFLGEKATKWQENDEIDGLTTNGILIMHPRNSFYAGSTEPGLWREVSVGGGLHSLRENRSATQKGKKIEDDTNILRDGTLINLCGATLLYRSAEGLRRSPTRRLLEQKIFELNAGRPQCPVGLNTLVIPRKSTILASDKEPYVYLNCGHVQGLHGWGTEEESDARTCPMCLEVGPIVKLIMGIEPSFYVDCGPPNFAFNPCGHMATERTIKYWASVAIPYGTSGFQSACPFCATLLSGCPGYTRLIFQDNID